jgi:hypothetical protein
MRPPGTSVHHQLGVKEGSPGWRLWLLQQLSLSGTALPGHIGSGLMMTWRSQQQMLLQTLVTWMAMQHGVQVLLLPLFVRMQAGRSTSLLLLPTNLAGSRQQQ